LGRPLKRRVSACRILVERDKVLAFGSMAVVEHGTTVSGAWIKFRVEISSVRPWFGICVGVGRRNCYSDGMWES